MKQKWYFIFSENSVFKKRFIKFYGTRDQCAVNQRFWHLDGLVSAVMTEKDFKHEKFLERGFEELNIEKE